MSRTRKDRIRYRMCFGMFRRLTGVALHACLELLSGRMLLFGGPKGGREGSRRLGPGTGKVFQAGTGRHLSSAGSRDGGEDVKCLKCLTEGFRERTGDAMRLSCGNMP